MIPSELAYFLLTRFIEKNEYNWNRFWNRTRPALGQPEDPRVDPGALGGLLVSGERIGSNVPIEAWTDGYRLALAWLFDVYAWALFADRLDTRSFLVSH